MQVEELIKLLSKGPRENSILVDIGQEEESEIIDVLIGRGTIRGFTFLKIDPLEKQIPKKPLILSYKPLTEIGWKYECPSCNCAIGENSNASDYTQEDDYCSCCGQKIDWN